MEQREGEAHCGQCKTYKPVEEFTPSQQHNGGWCRSCHRAYYRAQRPALPSKPCERCGTTIEEPKPRQRFCSSNCKMRARYWRDNPRETRSCDFCDADITHMRRDARFCNDVCAGKHRGRHLTPEQRRAYRLWSKYRITAADYDALLAQQDGACAICDADAPGTSHGFWHVDHCHTGGQVRGLLCSTCNTGLGSFRDQPSVLRRAAKYLEVSASN